MRTAASAFRVCALIGVVASAPSLARADGSAAGGEKIYRMRSKDGTTLYTNVEERVPLALRKQAEVDLSKARLIQLGEGQPDPSIPDGKVNAAGPSEVVGQGSESDDVAASAAAAGSRAEAPASAGRTRALPPCTESSAPRLESVLDRMWNEQRTLLICAGLGLLFMLFGPLALRALRVPWWGRVLIMALPSITAAAAVATGILDPKTLLDSAALSASVPERAPCTPARHDALGALREQLNDLQRINERQKKPLVIPEQPLPAQP